MLSILRVNHKNINDCILYYKSLIFMMHIRILKVLNDDIWDTYPATSVLVYPTQYFMVIMHI